MKSNLFLFLVVVLVGFFPGITSDIYIPSVPTIADDLKTSIDKVQGTLSIFMFGLSISQLVYGPISEGIGRRYPLIIGLLIMTVGSFVCFYASSIETLLLGRFIQGLGVGAGASLWRSIFRDSFEGPQLAKYGGYLSVLVAFIVPAAPVLGGYLQIYFGWRANFLFLIFYALATVLIILVLFKETSAHHHKERLSRKFFMHAFGQLLSSRVFMGYTICTFISYGAFFAWLTASPVLLIKLAGISPVEFGYVTFLGGGGAMLLSGFINGKMVVKFGIHFMLRMGWALMFMAGSLMMALKFIYGMNTAIIVAPMVLFYFGSTFIWPSIFAGAFAPFGKIAGYAGSLYSFMQLGGGAAISALVSCLPNADQVPIASIFMICSLLSWIVFEFIVVSSKEGAVN
ncbi:MAG: multidrug resistance transporter, Bcr family [Alphaproteobacteria bacterium]|jgi:DHA1 family bicyclomycin/chloramphenicol resistance-like MFS transporter/DHA1 family 2-module integral membrane pump EmrD-like MFS transporter|nr:multidrug resistance transporter, Bcr family [Alphaproteobacteria bacterium]